ncbi:MAG: homocysteine S-methyltransferase family protein [Clostridia bacterium]|nr:homocysteine S-methyltransferase family protein [Clostridia bacterium]
MKFTDALGKKLLFFDGGMGTMLQSAGLKPGEIPDLWNITNAEKVMAVHRAYAEAGSNIIITNTFGCNDLKLAGSGYTAFEIAAASVRNAKAAISGLENRFVALDIGPSGKLLKPLGDLDFEDAVELFAKTVRGGVSEAPDLILVETMSDAYELKAAVLAAKENSHLPVVATVTLDSRGKLLTGGDAQSVCALLEGLGADAIGFNCGLGPREMLPFLRELREVCSLPMVLQPNAGLPRSEKGRTVFDVGPEEFAELMESCIAEGVWLAGGCCGTTPAHIEALVKRCGKMIPPAVRKKNLTVAASYGQALYFGADTKLIGERINPTGKPLMKKALLEGDHDMILREGILQQEQGAHALDVNAGLPGIEEAKVLTSLTKQLQAVTDLPLQLDSADPAALESALRIYNGKAIINSVNGKQESMEAIFPIAKKYGGVIVALTLDENGIPEDAEGRMAIARRILERAKDFGLGPNDFIFDPLTLTVSAGGDNGKITLECVRRLKGELGVCTSLGVSNVSFGLPNRGLLNSAFLTLAMGAGLSAAIVNPHAPGMLEAYRSARALLGMDENCAGYISAFGGEAAPAAAAGRENMSLYESVLKGLAGAAVQAAERELMDKAPLEVIEQCMVPALNTAGERFEKGTLFLPQLLMCAEAAKGAFGVIRSRMGEGEGMSRGKVVLATVQGDVHDIGKNIVKALLENYRFKVIDLGKDVAPEDIVKAAEEQDAGLVGLSALMTTTVPSMQRTVELLKERMPRCKVMCGGAVLTADYAGEIGAHYYAKDAMAGVRCAMEVYPE